MSLSSTAVVTRWFDEFWNKGNESVADELLAPNGTFYGFPSATEHVDAAGFVAAGRQFRSAFSDIHISVDDLITEPDPSTPGQDRVAARWTARLTHSGDGLGFAPTGHRIVVPGISITHIRDGRIAAGWNALDLTEPIAHLRTLAANRSQP